MVEGCLFCKIAAREIPTTEVLSTETVFAFRDIDPQAPTHVLVIPRTHVKDAAQVGSQHGALLADMLEATTEVARREGLANGYRLVMNVGDDAGNTVPHLHVHVIGGRKLGWPPG